MYINLVVCILDIGYFLKKKNTNRIDYAN